MKKILTALIIACGISVFISIPVSASENATDINSGVVSPYAILQEIRPVATPSGWVNLNCSFGYLDYYKTIAGINYVHITKWNSSKINGVPAVSYYNATSHIVITVTYVRMSDFNYVSEIITIYP